MEERDIVGEKFGKLTVIRFDHRDKNKKKHYLCKCDCGNEKVINRNNLVSGKTKSCGCIKINRLKSKIKKYSKNTHPKMYNTWSSMKQRCYNPKVNNYDRYGERGIAVCSEWKNSFVKFAEWALDNGYKEGLSIDRIDPNGNYEPNNCRWATIEQQSNNKRSSLLIDYNGEKLTVAELSKKLNIPYTTVHSKYKQGKYKMERNQNET